MKKLLASTLALTAVGATTAAAATTVPDGTFHGRTSQGFKARVVVDKGQVQFVLLPWRAKRCTPHTGYSVTYRRWNYRNSPNGPIEQTPQPDRFHDGGRLVHKQPGARDVIVGRLTGHFVDSDHVEGTQTIRVRTHDKYGRHRCTAKIHWSAVR
jgi:hypothetical protein